MAGSICEEWVARAARFSQYASRTTTLRPLMCLHTVQSQSSAGDFSGLFDDEAGARALVTDCEAYVFTPSMLAGCSSHIPIDWASPQQPSPLCLTRSCWGGFAYSLDETSMKMRGRPSAFLADIGSPGDRARSPQRSKRSHLIWSHVFLGHIFETLATKCIIVQTITETWNYDFH